MRERVVLITGGLGGCGRSTVLAFAKERASVVFSGRCEHTGALLALELDAMGVKSLFITADVRIESDVKGLIRGAVAFFGRIDVAVNNIGTEGSAGPLVDQTVEDYAATFDANVLATVLCMKHELRAMYIQGSGCVINISSMVGRKRGANASLYTASNHAIESLTKVTALEATPHGVRINAVAPGPIETGMLSRFVGGTAKMGAASAGVNSNRVNMHEEVADAVLFIASDRARSITGQVLGVDGGKTIF